MVIDNDYIEFFVRDKSIPWACTFIGSNREHPRKREIFAEDLFVQYVKILESYHLRISGDEKKAEQLGIDILEQLKDESVKKVLSELFKKAGSSYKPKTVAQWIQDEDIEGVNTIPLSGV